jgi:hypothetical protein
MAFDVLPGPSGPLPIAGQQTSQLFDIKLPPGEKTFFLRFIALFRDNEPLGGEAPTFQIKSGTGDLTPVGLNPAGVKVIDGDGNFAGAVICERGHKDVFLLTISEIEENTGPWKIRIRNNDSESLRFLGFTSTQVDQTLQPWLVIGKSSSAFSFSPPMVGVIQVVIRTTVFEVRNLGTTPLIFFEKPGPIAEDSQITLTEKPDRVDLHQLRTLAFNSLSTDPLLIHNASPIEHFLLCNDTIKEHTKIEFSEF